jgi:hypothetical protein
MLPPNETPTNRSTGEQLEAENLSQFVKLLYEQFLYPLSPGKTVDIPKFLLYWISRKEK